MKTICSIVLCNVKIQSPIRFINLIPFLNSYSGKCRLSVWSATYCMFLQSIKIHFLVTQSCNSNKTNHFKGMVSVTTVQINFVFKVAIKHSENFTPNNRQSLFYFFQKIWHRIYSCHSIILQFVTKRKQSRMSIYTSQYHTLHSKQVHTAVNWVLFNLFQLIEINPDVSCDWNRYENFSFGYLII